LFYYGFDVRSTVPRAEEQEPVGEHEDDDEDDPAEEQEPSLLHALNED
jgi:hypothetical protein